MNANDVLIDLLEDNLRRLRRVFDLMNDDCLVWKPEADAKWMIIQSLLNKVYKIAIRRLRGYTRIILIRNIECVCSCGFSCYTLVEAGYGKGGRRPTVHRRPPVSVLFHIETRAQRVSHRNYHIGSAPDKGHPVLQRLRNR
jgi:hypothetical protein